MTTASETTPGCSCIGCRGPGSGCTHRPLCVQVAAARRQAVRDEVRLARLSSPMRAHLTYGIGGATGQTLRGLANRGLIEEDVAKSDADTVVWRLSAKGERFRDSLRAEAGL